MGPSSIFSVRIKNGREKEAALLLKSKIEHYKLAIDSILVVDSIKGYIFVEGTKHDVEKGVDEMKIFAGKIIGKVTVEELDAHLIPKPTIEAVNVVDIVEIIAGPFKVSRAKFSGMSVTREELTLDLLDSIITIPIVLHADNVRKIESAASIDQI